MWVISKCFLLEAVAALLRVCGDRGCRGLEVRGASWGPSPVAGKLTGDRPLGHCLQKGFPTGSVSDPGACSSGLGATGVSRSLLQVFYGTPNELSMCTQPTGAGGV